MEHQHTDQVQHHVQDRRHCQKDQRHHRVADGAEKVCKVVVEESGRDAEEDDEEVVLHQRLQLFGHPQHPEDAVQPQIDQQVQHQRDPRDEDEGLEHAPAHFFGFAAAILHRDGRAAAHAQAQQNRGEEGHEGVGRADRRQRVGAEEAPHHPCVGDVVHLLQQVAEHERQGKEQDAAGNGA